MRNAFCQAMIALAADPNFVFLTGDLGYKALEPLREALGPRFINAGVAEQNMVSVAAGLARTGLKPWAYSIAPFIYARPFEQIRNDVCLHRLPVRLVGNGGGYGYGVMGSTHHALEDYGTLLGLAHLGMRAYVPIFDADVGAIAERLATDTGPAYLRLGLSEQPKDYPTPAYAVWRRLATGAGPTVVAVGPIAGGLLAEAVKLSERRRPTIWGLSELPFGEPPPEFLDDIEGTGHLVVVEEHVAHGGAGPDLAAHLLARGRPPRRFTHLAAAGYPSGLYGSQRFHRAESGLDPASIIGTLVGDEGAGLP
jgi:transketolase